MPSGSMFNVGPGIDFLRQRGISGGGNMGMPGQRGASSPVGGMSSGGGGGMGMPGMRGPSSPVGGMPPFDVAPPNMPSMTNNMSIGSPMGPPPSMGIPSQPSPNMPSGPVMGGGSPPMPKPGMSMRDRMSQDRPGMWGIYNRISQNLQPGAMRMLGM